MAAERLQKLIAASGLCSRRHAEDLLRQGRVKLNGALAALGDRADPRVDDLRIDGRPLNTPAAPLLLLVNKPPGVLTTNSDPQGRPTVLDLLPRELRDHRGLHPVGRLDAESRGILLLTNDGALTLRLTHPRYGHAKTYQVWVRGTPTPITLERWRAGVALEQRPSRNVEVRRLERQAKATLLELVMREGRHRQIRRTAALLGHPVLDLKRVAIGNLHLADLPEGCWRQIHPQEIDPPGEAQEWGPPVESI